MWPFLGVKHSRTHTHTPFTLRVLMALTLSFQNVRNALCLIGRASVSVKVQTHWESPKGVVTSLNERKRAQRKRSESWLNLELIVQGNLSEQEDNESLELTSREFPHYPSHCVSALANTFW